MIQGLRTSELARYNKGIGVYAEVVSKAGQYVPCGVTLKRESNAPCRRAVG